MELERLKSAFMHKEPVGGSLPHRIAINVNNLVLSGWTDFP